ncbi:MAG TPA: hypothetical protein VL328_15780 [Gemmatimonadaceae bacterium]|jgi:hypothetical protein|nr:hypothetical protein [Gemmatimonadaceae bacterium]
MSIRSYRLTLVICALAWFLVGLHAPLLHAWTSHGHAPDATVAIATSLLAITAIVALVMLLRASGSPSQRP